MREKCNQDPTRGYDVVSSLLYSRPRTSNKLCPCQKFLYMLDICYLYQTRFVVKLKCGQRKRRNRFLARNISFLTVHIENPPTVKGFSNYL